MIPKELESVLSHNPGIMSGAICFAGTRVPVRALLDTLDDGNNIQDFLQGFPDVTPQQAQAVLHWEQMQARRVLEAEPAE